MSLMASKPREVGFQSMESLFALLNSFMPLAVICGDFNPPRLTFNGQEVRKLNS